MPKIRRKNFITRVASLRHGESARASSPRRGESHTRAGDGVRAPPPRRGQSQIRAEDEDYEPELEPDSGDDCAIAGDEDCEAVDDAIAEEDDENDVNDLGVEEDANLNLEEDFPVALREYEAGSDGDSGDDIWEKDKIPDPLSSDDEGEVEDEEKDKEEAARRDNEDPEVLLALEKTYNSPEDFKLAVFRYSLQTRYNIKLYRSQSMRISAKCCYVDNDVKCLWRVYCSYEKRKHKMQIKVCGYEHICIRSGYSKMLKRSTISLLFEEML